MQAEESFDAFYLMTRRGLLHQTFALTGDLPAAQTAVRDAYVAAWHHWHKVEPLGDRNAWIRRFAWTAAQRRLAGRIWRRNRGMAADHLATLDALARLSTPQRRILVLIQIAGTPLQQAAREVGVTQHVAEQHLQSATATLSSQLEAEPATLRAALIGLGSALEQVRLPRAPIIRRAGRKRRRLHTGAAVLAAAAVAVSSGAVAYEPGATDSAGPRQATPLGAVALPAEARVGAGVAAEPEPDEETGPEPDVDAGVGAGETLPTADNLLDQDQIRRLGLRQRWKVEATQTNTSGDGINTICQRARFADPDGLSALVREFAARGPVRRTAVQTVEISKSAAQARKGFRTTLGWYAGCQASRLQLLDAYRVDNIGAEADVLTMRVWKRPVTTYSVAVARIGSVTTSTVGKSVGVDPPAAGQITQSLADAVSMLCASSGSQNCAKQPEYTVVPPPPSGEAKGILAVADLPPVGRIVRPWVGTTATGGRPNPAMTTCDRADFVAGGAMRSRSRTYLVPGADLPARFGLSETYGIFRSPARADGFLAGVRRRMAGCEDRDRTTEVTAAASRRTGPGSAWWSWDLTTEIAEDETIEFRLGFVRVGRQVAQLTFAPSAQHDMTALQFRALLARAGDRLRELR